MHLTIMKKSHVVWRITIQYIGIYFGTHERVLARQ